MQASVPRASLLWWNLILRGVDDQGMFYVEGECEPPALMLMKTGKTDITSTISRVEDIPQEIVSRAVESPVQPPIHGMYAITDEIRDWLKKELGL